MGDQALAKCVIPKGSKYYLNGIGEVVSDRIVIKNYGLLQRFTYGKEGNIIEFDDVPMESLES